MTAISDLLACPFCGSQPEYFPRIEGPWHQSHWPETVHCKLCRITFRTAENGVTSAVQKWNTRPLLPLISPVTNNPQEDAFYEKAEASIGKP